MATAAKKAFGTLLQDGNAATPELFTTVAEVRTITGGKATGKTTEVTSHDSAAEAAEFISTYYDEGEIGFEANYTAAANQVAVRTALNGVAGNWQLCYPNWQKRQVTFTAAGDQITATSHALTTGQPVQVSSSGTLPTGVSASTVYFVRYVGGNTIQLHLTNAAAVAGTGAISLSAGSGTHKIDVGSRISFAGIVSAESKDAPLDGALGLMGTIKVTGPVTVT